MESSFNSFKRLSYLVIFFGERSRSPGISMYFYYLVQELFGTPEILRRLVSWDDDIGGVPLDSHDSHVYMCKYIYIICIYCPFVLYLYISRFIFGWG